MDPIECTKCGKIIFEFNMVLNEGDDPFCSDCAEQLGDEAYDRQKEEGICNE